MATFTPLALRSHVLLPPSSTKNPRFHGFTKRQSPSRVFFPSRSSQIPKPIRIVASASRITPILPVAKSTNRTLPITGPNRSLATLLALTIAVTRVLAHKLSLAIQFSSPVIVDGLRTAGPVFFASLRVRPLENLNTPVTVVAVGLKKWLDIYYGILTVRVLLSWFPNFPWERQPLSALRDLCDPYLNLFRNIIPPVFGTHDVSSWLAFAVLGTLASIAESSSSS